MLVQNTLANQYPSALRENILSAMLVSRERRTVVLMIATELQSNNRKRQNMMMLQIYTLKNYELEKVHCIV
jgi:hypothetical protein